MKAIRSISVVLFLLGIALFLFGIMDHGAYWHIGKYSILMSMLAMFLWVIVEPTPPIPPREPALSEAYKYKLLYDKKAKYWIMTVEDEPGCTTIGDSPEEAMGRMKNLITRYDCIEQE